MWCPPMMRKRLLRIWKDFNKSTVVSCTAGWSLSLLFGLHLWWPKFLASCKYTGWLFATSKKNTLYDKCSYFPDGIIISALVLKLLFSLKTNTLRVPFITEWQYCLYTLSFISSDSLARMLSLDISMLYYFLFFKISHIFWHNLFLSIWTI